MVDEDGQQYRNGVPAAVNDTRRCSGTNELTMRGTTMTTNPLVIGMPRHRCCLTHRAYPLDTMLMLHLEEISAAC